MVCVWLRQIFFFFFKSYSGRSGVGFSLGCGAPSEGSPPPTAAAGRGAIGGCPRRMMGWDQAGRDHEYMAGRTTRSSLPLSSPVGCVWACVLFPTTNKAVCDCSPLVFFFEKVMSPLSVTLYILAAELAARLIPHLRLALQGGGPSRPPEKYRSAPSSWLHASRSSKPVSHLLSQLA